MSEFKVGDVVVLKSGGPRMTVERVTQVGEYRPYEDKREPAPNYERVDVAYFEPPSGGGFLLAPNRSGLVRDCFPVAMLQPKEL